MRAVPERPAVGLSILVLRSLQRIPSLPASFATDAGGQFESPATDPRQSTSVNGRSSVTSSSIRGLTIRGKPKSYFQEPWTLCDTEAWKQEPEIDLQCRLWGIASEGPWLATLSSFC